MDQRISVKDVGDGWKTVKFIVANCEMAIATNGEMVHIITDDKQFVAVQLRRDVCYDGPSLLGMKQKHLKELILDKELFEI